MRYLVTADVHVESWSRYDLYPGFRLSQYERLAEWLNDLVVSYKVDLIIIAGDFFHKPVNPPKVLLTGIRLIKSLASSAPVVMVHGQHDLDVRDKTSPMLSNSLVSLVREVDPTGSRVHYLHNSSVEVGGERIFGYGWEPTFSPDVSAAAGAKVVVLHGQVRGSKSGNVRFDGFDPLEFFPSSYSFVGDVHQYQVLGDGRVIVPGPPIYHTFSDRSAGVVVFDSSSGDHEYIPSGYVRGERLYSFLRLVQEDRPIQEEVDRESLTVVRGKSDYTVKREEIAPSNSPVEIIRSLAEDAGLSDVLAECQSEIVSYEDSPYFHPLFWEPVYMEIENFRSIRRLSIDFSNTGKLIYVSGPNGSGKSSLLMAILWVLTGSGDKSLIRSGEKSMRVRLDFEYLGQSVTLVRGIDGSQYLDVWVDGQLMDAPSLREKQQRLESRFPFIKAFDQICYFDQFRPGFVTSMSSKQRVDLISDIFGLSFIQKLRDVAEKKAKEEQTRFESYRAQFDSLTEAVRSMESIEAELSGLHLTEEEVEEFEAIKKVVSEISEEIRRREVEERTARSEVAKLAREIEDASQKIRLVRSERRCYVCGSLLSGEKSKELSLSLAESLREKQEEMDRLQEEIDRLREEVSRLSSTLDRISRRYDELLGKVSHHESLASRYERLKGQIDGIRSNLSALSEEMDRSSHRLDAFKRLSKMVQTTAYVRVLDRVSEALSDDSVKVSTKHEYKTGSVKPTVDLYYRVHSGEYLPFDLLSGGQRTLADLHLLFRLVSVVGGVGLLVFDETFRFLDPAAYDEVFSMLSDIRASKVIYVSHDISPSIRFDSQISVSWRDGESVYYVDQ